MISYQGIFTFCDDEGVVDACFVIIEEFNCSTQSKNKNKNINLK